MIAYLTTNTARNDSLLSKIKFALLITLSCIGTFPHIAFAEAKVTYFYDGDTVKIQDGTWSYKLRISNIDAPERNQSYGKKARRALMQFCKHARIDVAMTGFDKYHRQLGELYCNQQPVSTHMVANGHAWVYRQHSNDIWLNELEASAKQQKLGLWRQKKPIPPWQWRKRHRH